MRWRGIKIFALLGALSLLSTACTAPPPSAPHDVCAIFEERRSWYRAAKRGVRRWQIPVPVTMAFIYQESSFRARAKPPRKRWFFGLLPGLRRLSNAYGYAQALDETWDLYRRDARRRGADRNNFRDAVDFVGWYNRQSVQRLGIDPADAYNLYLAYHEGWGGYRKQGWRNKQWLLQVANKVQARAWEYERQLGGCEEKLARRRWWSLWLF